MSEHALGDATTRPASWYESAALVASLAAFALSMLLCLTVLARAADWEGRILDPATDETLLAVGLTWLALAVGGIVCGFIALFLPHRRRARALAAIVLSTASLLAVPAAALAAASDAVGPHHPTDETLIYSFNEHEVAFAALVRDLEARGNVGKDRLRALGVESVERATGSRFFLQLSSYGIVPSGSAKGYLYSTHPVQPTVDDLDEDHLVDGYTYRHISGPWYLYYERW